MNYQTFEPQPNLQPVVKCYWTLEVDGSAASRQRIVPDGCVEMIFTLGSNIKRYISETEYIIQPRAMMLGQITQPFFIQPTGNVNTFAARFYPHSFANFTSIPLNLLADKETPLKILFGEEAEVLESDTVAAQDTSSRIAIVEDFLLKRMSDKETIHAIVKSTVDMLFRSQGAQHINSILSSDEPSKRRQLERKFAQQVGLSPKQLGRVFRLQAALKLMLGQGSDSLTRIAYESNYYDQSHFIKDFKDLTGASPGEFMSNEELQLSTLFYTPE